MVYDLDKFHPTIPQDFFRQGRGMQGLKCPPKSRNNKPDVDL